MSPFCGVHEWYYFMNRCFTLADLSLKIMAESASWGIMGFCLLLKPKYKDMN